MPVSADGDWGPHEPPLRQRDAPSPTLPACPGPAAHTHVLGGLARRRVEPHCGTVWGHRVPEHRVWRVAPRAVGAGRCVPVASCLLLTGVDTHPPASRKHRCPQGGPWLAPWLLGSGPASLIAGSCRDQWPVSVSVSSPKSPDSTARGPDHPPSTVPFQGPFVAQFYPTQADLAPITGVAQGLT